MTAGLWIVFAFAAGATVLASVYFRRVRMPRPPLGVFNRADVLIMLATIALMPYLYLALPLWLDGVLLGALTTGILYVTLVPMLPPGAGVWCGILALVAAHLASWWRFGPTGATFALVNNVVLTVAVVGVSNVWAQSGMKARDAALLGGLLAIYDVVFTVQLPVMNDLLTRLAAVPFAPQVVWPTGDGQWVGLGLGDLLLATAFPLVRRKAFGQTAGLAASATSITTVGTLLGLAGLGVLGGAFPAMVVLGPGMLLQYALWRYRQGQERTTWHYLRAEPLPQRG